MERPNSSYSVVSDYKGCNEHEISPHFRNMLAYHEVSMMKNDITFLWSDLVRMIEEYLNDNPTEELPETAC